MSKFADRVCIGKVQQADPRDHIQLLFLFSMCTLYNGDSALGETSLLLMSFGGHRRNSFANFLI